jgi:hypothetical protein
MSVTFAKAVKPGMKRAFAFGLVISVTSIGSVATAEPTQSVTSAAPEPAQAPAATKASEPLPQPASAKADSTPPAAKPAGPEPARPGATVRTVGYVVECVGMAGIIAGAVVKAMSSAKHDVIDVHCDASRVCDQTGLDATSAASKLQTAAFASLVGGIAALGVGIALVVSSPEGGAPHASLGPAVVHGGAGLGISGGF